jgi:N6-L-threonylcarbamoyladenine synthase
MRILSIETSCDDTCISIVEKEKENFKVIFSEVSSQIEIHKKWGGVYPTLAVREHKKNLPIIFKKISKEMPTIDFIAVTKGPGLEPCLWAGINFAKEISKKWNIPIIPIDHIESHILAVLLEENVKFPALSLIVSGGHTQLVLIKEIGDYKIIGETRDDAAGECFDKTARILGLEYPGGPIISKTAEKKENIDLPRPMINQKNYDFSFSGLKTAVLYNFKKREIKDKNYIKSMCYLIQQAIIDVLIKKTIRAAKNYKVKSIILSGGVASNKELRKQLKEKSKGINFYVPKKEYCTDNAVMTAITAFYHLKETKKDIKADSNLRIGEN